MNGSEKMEGANQAKATKRGLIAAVVLGIIVPFIGWIFGIVALANVKSNPVYKKQGLFILAVSTVAFFAWFAI